jgi:signal-transduction protein with cAMP-binding, CBS, and nucleotidyltransferase domain
MTKSFHQIFEGATTEEIENIMKLIDLLYSMLVKKNVAARNFTQVLSKFNDFLISRFDVSKATILFDSLYFT